MPKVFTFWHDIFLNSVCLSSHITEGYIISNKFIWIGNRKEHNVGQLETLHCFILWKTQWQPNSNNIVYIICWSWRVSYCLCLQFFLFQPLPQKSDYLFLGHFHIFSLCSQEKGVSLYLCIDYLKCFYYNFK